MDFQTVPRMQADFPPRLSYRSQETGRPSFLTVPRKQSDSLPFWPFAWDKQMSFFFYCSKETIKLTSFLTVPRIQTDFLPFLPFQRDLQTSFLSYRFNETPRLSYRSKKTSRLPDCSTAAQETRNEQKCSSRQQYTVYQVYTLDRKINYICIINVYICIFYI